MRKQTTNIHDSCYRKTNYAAEYGHYFQKYITKEVKRYDSLKSYAIYQITKVNQNDENFEMPI